MTARFDAGSSESETCTRRVATVLKEKNVPYELISVDLTKGAQKDPSFTKHQPFGQVPYIKYAEQGTPDLIPTDPKAAALFEQAASTETFNFDPFASGIILEKVIKKRRGFETNEVWVTELATTLDAKLDAYEVILSKQKYLGGDNVTLADLFHLPSGSMLGAAGFSDILEKRPNVARWWKDISSRPAWLAVKDGA
ncbi:glutathione S-transferase-like protein [Hygrophoropsis aurantiaca]|uniref:Glutathione S-transferase-like protein n=1 Tax=Hygrophoropsis aurantiaca TaxID=72124 RepID=A0ACB8A1Z6_9AGAM|nr:glutathione S-transferase-like protein [Hygrophoropsis aurantiaca]